MRSEYSANNGGRSACRNTELMRNNKNRLLRHTLRIAIVACFAVTAFCLCRSEAAHACSIIVPSSDGFGYPSIDIRQNKASSKWESDVSKIESRYGQKLPEVDCIFYGSSSIRKWKTLDEDMKELKVLNHGFGGSKVPDCLYYADRLVKPFKPKAVAFYAGTNDIGKGSPVWKTYDYTLLFFNYIHRELPDTKILYIAQTQQPDRVKHWRNMQRLNTMVKEYAENDPLVTYIGTEEILNNEDGTPRTELFVEDGLHFNEMGYEVWTSVLPGPYRLTEYTNNRITLEKNPYYHCREGEELTVSRAEYQVLAPALIDRMFRDGDLDLMDLSRVNPEVVKEVYKTPEWAARTIAYSRVEVLQRCLLNQI